MELQLKLNQFEGPLDLLLHLLDKDKIDIKDNEPGRVLFSAHYLYYTTIVFICQYLQIK